MSHTVPTWQRGILVTQCFGNYDTPAPHGVGIDPTTLRPSDSSEVHSSNPLRQPPCLCATHKNYKNINFLYISSECHPSIELTSSVYNWHSVHNLLTLTYKCYKLTNFTLKLTCIITKFMQTLIICFNNFNGLKSNFDDSFYKVLINLTKKHQNFKSTAVTN